MKILFLTNSFSPALGGAEKVCKEIVTILSKAHNVTVITQPHPDRKNMKNVIEMPAKTSYSYMPDLAGYINTHDFDLYIAFGYGKYFTDYIGQWTKKHNKPSIVMPCGFFHTNSNALFKKVYSTLVTRKSLNNFSVRITATQWEKDFWHDKFGVTNNNSFVVPYNLEKDFTKYKKTQILKKYRLKKKQYLLYIGRTGPNKLIQLLKDAYNLTDKSIPLVIAGKGNEKFNYLPKQDVFLKTLTDEDVAKMKKNYNILSMGVISEDDKKTLIAGAKCCVFPSSYESFGMVILESIALGTPVIGSGIGPFREILKNDDYIFENDVNSLARKLDKVITEDVKCQKILISDFKIRLNAIIFGVKHKIFPFPSSGIPFLDDSFQENMLFNCEVEVKK